MKFNIPRDFDMKKLLSNLDHLSRQDMRSHVKAATGFCFTKCHNPSLSLYIYNNEIPEFH
jgi:hypothetical protein